MYNDSINDFIIQEKVHKRQEPRYMMFGADDTIRIHWDIIMICNQHCSYCYARELKDKWNNLNNIKNINDVLSKLKQIEKPLEVALLGGEPTLSPYYEYILKELYKLEKLRVFGVISNNNLSDEKFNKILNLHKSLGDKFNWNITYHPTEVKDIDKFKSRLKQIKQQNLILNVNIMLTSAKEKDLILDMIDFCVLNNISYYFNVIFNHNATDYMNTNNDYKEFLQELDLKYPDRPKEQKFYRKDGSFIEIDDVISYLSNLSELKDWQCHNNNFDIPVNSSEIHHFCNWNSVTIDQINNNDCWMKCPNKLCLCQGKLTTWKYKPNSGVTENNVREFKDFKF